MSEEFWRGAVPELYQLREENAALRAEVERLQDRFDAVRDAAHAEAKRVFPATIIESHFGGEPHADDLCSMLAAEVERLREERRWRSTKTEPPSDEQWEILIYDGRDIDIGSKLDGCGWTHEFGLLEWEAVTHWQPLPAPPVKEEE